MRLAACYTGPHELDKFARSSNVPQGTVCKQFASSHRAWHIVGQTEFRHKRITLQGTVYWVSRPFEVLWLPSTQDALELTISVAENSVGYIGAWSGAVVQKYNVEDVKCGVDVNT